MNWIRRTAVLLLLVLIGLAAAAWLPRDSTTVDLAANRIEFRYTADGWIPVSELVAAAVPTEPGWPERLSPMTVATMQLLAGLLVLMVFDRPPAAGDRPGNVRTGYGSRRPSDACGAE